MGVLNIRGVGAFSIRGGETSRDSKCNAQLSPFKGTTRPPKAWDIIEQSLLATQNKLGTAGHLVLSLQLKKKPRIMSGSV